MIWSGGARVVGWGAHVGLLGQFRGAAGFWLENTCFEDQSEEKIVCSLLPAIPPIVGRLEDDVLDACTRHVSRRLTMLNVSQDSLPSIAQADARSPHLVEGAAGLLLAAKALEVGGRRVSHGLDMFRNRLSRPVYSHSLGWHAGLAGLLRTLDASSAEAWLAANRAQLGRRLDLGTSSPAHTARGVWGAEHGLGALDLSLRRLSIDVCKSVLGEAVL